MGQSAYAALVCAHGDIGVYPDVGPKIPVKTWNRAHGEVGDVEF